MTDHVIDCPRCGHCCPQPNQEPVAWYDKNGMLTHHPFKGVIPLYRAPYPWVGLTDKEIKSLPSWWPSYEDAPALVQLVKDVEAKLREKNGG